MDRRKRIAFLVTHGTDTMAWGLSYLTYALSDVGFNLALVGSQIPMDDRANGSDAYLNLESAVLALSSLVPPRIFVSMNAGKSLFQEHAWKVDKWDLEAFDGKVLMQKQSNQIVWDNAAAREDAEPRLDVLYVLRTGGTIEQSMSGGVLRPDSKDKVTVFLKDAFREPKKDRGKLVDEVEGFGLMARDSSDLTPRDWRVVADAVVKLARECGYACSVKDGPAEDVDVIFATPFGWPVHLERVAEERRGVVYVGYGGGNVHLASEERSPLGFFRQVRARGGWVVLTSHPVGGVLDPLYENGAAVFEEQLALPAMDFSIARVQTKLGFILANMDAARPAAPIGAARPPAEVEQLVAILFLSGATFPRPKTREFFERLWGIRIPERDLLIDRTFADALELAKGYVGGRARRCFGLRDWLDAEDRDHRPAPAVILVPDDVAGYDRRGMEVDAAGGLRRILAAGFEWDVVTVPILPGILRDDDAMAVIDGARVLLFEGGRQVVRDEASFRRAGHALGPEMTDFYRAAVTRRAENRGTASRIHISFSHQMLAHALLALVDDAMRDPAVPSDLRREAARLRERAVRGDGCIVKPNESREDRVVRLVPYEPSGEARELPELVGAHARVASRHGGLVERFLELDHADVCMLHVDEVDERGILYVNWALDRLAAVREASAAGARDVSAAGARDVTAVGAIRPLPIGVEITSSTRGADGRVLTEVASIAVYYRDAEGHVHRDLGFQFHPELMLADELREARSDSEIRLDFRNDGLKILLAALVG